MKIDLPVRERGECCALPIPVDSSRIDATVAVLKAMADPVRMGMLAALARAEQPICVCDFTAVFALSQPTISHHIGKLRDAGLVDVSRIGIWAHYTLRPALAGDVRRLVAAATRAATG